jgi:RHS repeat-associated protein
VLLQAIVGGTATHHSLFHDALGSLVRITDAAGVVANTLDFLAFGGRRDPATQATGGTAPSLTPRGFTGHERLDGFGLIHMNARLCDASLGRFLQPDPLIQARVRRQRTQHFARASWR